MCPLFSDGLSAISFCDWVPESENIDLDTLPEEVSKSFPLPSLLNLPSKVCWIQSKTNCPPDKAKAISRSLLVIFYLSEWIPCKTPMLDETPSLTFSKAVFLGGKRMMSRNHLPEPHGMMGGGVVIQGYTFMARTPTAVSFITDWIKTSGCNH